MYIYIYIFIIIIFTYVHIILSCIMRFFVRMMIFSECLCV